MKKHLKYIEGTSDKFWQVEAQGIQLTVVYGKNGTSGTTQVKTFNSDEECLHMAEKLVAEKIKKGYSETGEVTITAKPKTEKETDLKNVLAEYDEMIKERRKDLLLPFLQTTVKGHLTGFKKHLNKCKRYWMDYVDLSKDPQFQTKKGHNWGRRGNDKQMDIIIWTAIAILDKTEIRSWGGDIFWQVENKLSEKKQWALSILLWAKPTSLDDLFLTQARAKNSWQILSYHHLIYLEENKVITYNPELFAHSLAKFTNTTHTRMNFNCLEFILSHPQSCTRDVPELFNYETDIANSRNWGGEEDGLRLWHNYFEQLIAKDKLKRGWVLQKSFEIQTKEWNTGIKGFFKMLIEKLDPSSEELVALQSNIYPMLQNSTNTIVNFGIECCKKIVDEPRFDKKSFIEWVEPALLRADIKSGIKNVLQVFEKIAAQHKKWQPQLTQSAAEVFNVPVLELQERTAKFIAKYGNKKDAALKEKLALYQPQLLGKVSDILKDLLEEQGRGTIDTSLPETYTFQPVEKNKLVEQVVLPQTWNDILFRVGQFIKSDETIDVEILWNAYCTQRHLFPEDYTAQLQPYFKQLSGGNELYCTCYKCATESYLKTKIPNINHPFVFKKSNWSSIKIFDVVAGILKKIDEKITSGSVRPLLSFPTHQPYWVAPKTLLERIIAYQEAGESIEQGDLSIAISRMAREQVADAIPLLDKLQGELKPLMAYCLGVSDKIELEHDQSLTDKLKAWTGNDDQTEKTRITSVWAVAARTFNPDGIFKEFEKTYLHNVPFVVTPFWPDISFKESWNEYYVNWQTKEKARTPSWWELQLSLPEFKKTPPNLLYSVDMFNKGNNVYQYLQSIPQANCMYSLMPQNNDPYSIYALLDCKIAEGSKYGIDVLLSRVGTAGFKQHWYNSLLWACSFFHSKKEIRAKGTEVLYNQIAQCDVDIPLLANTIAYLLNNKYSVFSRMTDGLLTIKDTTPIHNDALFQLFDTVLAKLSVKELPTGFKKLVESYYDLMLKTRRQPDSAAVEFLDQWKEQGSLKKLIKEITGTVKA